MRWTNSKDGNIRGNVRITYRFRKALIDWLCEHTGWSERKAVEWVRTELGYAGSDLATNSTVVVDEDGDPQIASSDDVDNDFYEGSLVYPGQLLD
jgi:hypothetical protein